MRLQAPEEEHMANLASVEGRGIRFGFFICLSLLRERESKSEAATVLRDDCPRERFEILASLFSSFSSTFLLFFFQPQRLSRPLLALSEQEGFEPLHRSERATEGLSGSWCSLFDSLLWQTTRREWERGGRGQDEEQEEEDEHFPSRAALSPSLVLAQGA